MASQEGMFDGLFMQVVQQSQGIEGFFDNVFSFLRRKTDFFSNQKMAEEMIVKHCQKNFLKFSDEKKKEQTEQAKKKEREEQRKREMDEKGRQEADKIAAEKAAKKAAEEEAKRKEDEAKASAVVEKKPELAESEKKEGDKKEEDTGPAPVGNGGTTDKYNWTQTLEELHVYIPVESDVKGKTLKVTIDTNHLYVGVVGKDPIINGDFPEKIHVDGSLWTLEDGKGGKYVHIAIEKWKNQWHWWECVIVGDPKIDTKKINPEPSNLSDLDGETKTTVEKMMFDMRQKQMGKPSSDELLKQDKLKDFMKAHPEMDFSKAKFN